jgi:hypothetical protein
MKPPRKRNAKFLHGNIQITVTPEGVVFRRKGVRASARIRWEDLILRTEVHSLCRE